MGLDERDTIARAGRQRFCAPRTRPPRSYYGCGRETGPVIVPAVPFIQSPATRVLRTSEQAGLKAIYQIPLCIACVYVTVQILRVSAVTLLDYLIRRLEDNPEKR